MVRLLIIADDFTGALDTGVQLSSAGAKARVLPHPPDNLSVPDEETQVLVVNTETRHLPPRRAYAIVERIVRQAAAQGIPHIYKKTDSALRGNVGAELSALLAASGERVLPFLPAFPQMGRTTVGGIHYIDGVPVSQSVFGSDPFTPVRRSSVRQLIGAQTSLPVQNVSPGQCPDLSQTSIAVYDAQSPADLERTGQALAQAGCTHILAGCAGFGAVLPRLLGLGSGHPPSLPPLSRRLLVVCGSLNPITLQQLDRAERSGFTRFHLTPEQKLDPQYWDTPPGVAAAEQLRRGLEHHERIVIDSSDPEGTQATAHWAKLHHIPPEQLRVNVSRSLGHMVRELISCPALGTLFLTGGDTLLSCMDALAVSQMEPLGELAPGVVLSQFSLLGRTRQVISKSGGFGDPDLLVHLTASFPQPQTT